MFSATMAATSATMDAAMASFTPMAATSATMDAAMASSSTQDAATATYRMAGVCIHLEA